MSLSHTSVRQIPTCTMQNAKNRDQNVLWILKIKKKVTMPRPVTVVPSRSTCRCCRSLRTARLRR